MSCGVGCRRGLDPELLWLRLAAVAPIPSPAEELPDAIGVVLKSKKEKERGRKEGRKEGKKRKEKEKEKKIHT